jgi:hypothetical protein
MHSGIATRWVKPLVHSYRVHPCNRMSMFQGCALLMCRKQITRVANSIKTGDPTMKPLSSKSAVMWISSLEV